MLALDANVLIYAHRADAPRHEEYARWLAAALAGPVPVGVPSLVLLAVVRICTNESLFDPPSTLDQAFAFCDEIMQQPAAARLQPGDGHWSTFRRLCRDRGSRGPNVTGAYIAALAIDARAQLITTDTGFGRFRGLRWRHPLG